MYILGDRVTLLCGVNGVVRSRHLLIDTSGVPPPCGRRRMKAVRMQCSDDPERGEIIVNIISLVPLRMSHSVHPREYNARVGRLQPCTDVGVHSRGFELA